MALSAMGAGAHVCGFDAVGLVAMGANNVQGVAHVGALSGDDFL